MNKAKKLYSYMMIFVLWIAGIVFGIAGSYYAFPLLATQPTIGEKVIALSCYVIAGTLFWCAHRVTKLFNE